MRNNTKTYSVLIFTSIALFFAILGLILSFLPLRMFALIPAIIAIYFTVIAYILSRVFKTKKSFVYTVFGISLLSILIAGITESVSDNVVVEDKEFEQKLEAQTQGVDSSLLEAFDEEVIVDKVDNEKANTDSSNVGVTDKPKANIQEEFVEEDIGEVEF